MALADHLSAELLAGYRQRRLKPALLLALDDHVTSCSVCRAMLRGIRPRRDALLSLRASLASDRLQTLVENRLDAVDRELADGPHVTPAKH